MRVLIVDDEVRYRVYLRAKLLAEGHEVAVASGGREAIDRGVEFRPDVLVTDWMLKNHLHGLHIAAALRTAKPDTRTILMTGFASQDLRAQAGTSRLTFMEKPFTPGDLAETVASVPPLPRYLQTSIPFGVILASNSGMILQASPKARQMMASTTCASAQKLRDLFGSGVPALIDACSADFQNVAPLAPRRVRWWVGARRVPSGTILVLLPERKRFLRFDERALLLLDRTLPEAHVRPEIRVVVIDAAPMEEATYVATLERCGCVCYKVENPELALKLLQAEPKIDVVVIDRLAVDRALPALVEELMRAQPSLRIVGVSSELSHHLDFIEAGVARFLHKPWAVGSLFQSIDE